MADATKNTEELVLKKISDLYLIGLFCYLIPTFFVVLLLIDTYTIQVTDILSFILLLCIMFPLSLIGISSTLTGIKLSAKINNVSKKNLGYYSFIFGTAAFIGQVFIFVFVYLKIR